MHLKQNNACQSEGGGSGWPRRNEQRHNRYQVEVNPSRARSCLCPLRPRRCSASECDSGEFRLVLSFHYINAAIDCSGLTPGEKLVLLVLANHANDQGFCYPSFNTLAIECSMRRRSVIRIVKALEAKKLVERVKRYPYNLLVTVCHQPKNPLVTKTTHVVTKSAKGSDRMSPKPSVTVTINTKDSFKSNGDSNRQSDWKAKLARQSKGDFSEDAPTISAST